MLIFLAAVLALILGYIFYGFFIEKVLHIDSKRLTPARTLADGVDFVCLKPYKVFLIQFLNIAGVGPVFGAILGALYGPVCLLWIVFGSIFAGAVHDMLSGVISMRFRGQTMTFMTHNFFRRKFSFVFVILLFFLLILVGAIFAQIPAHMLADITNWPFVFWLFIIFGYYFLATLLPVDKIIGRFYPIFATCLIVSSALLLICLFMQGGDFYPYLLPVNQHPKSLPIFPLMFVTVACGALSGFHATQSPLMARCLENEKNARPIFYGAMIMEGFIALIWATLGIAFYHGTSGLNQALGESGNTGKVMREIAYHYLGNLGGILTVLSVVFLTITSGDTAFRSARLSTADFFKIDQKKLWKRLIFTIFILSVGVLFSFVDLNKIWLYFGWSNQVLATLMLWMGALYLKQKKWLYEVALFPAVFMTAVCGTYVGYAPIFMGMSIYYSRILGLIVAFVCLIFFYKAKSFKRIASKLKNKVKK